MSRNEMKLVCLEQDLSDARRDELLANRSFEDGIISYDKYRSVCNAVDKLVGEVLSLKTFIDLED